MRFTTRVALIISRCVMALFLCLTATVTTGLAQSATPQPAQPVVEVDCDAGDSLADALAEYSGDTTFNIRGTCLEQLVITHNGVTIDGGGSAVLDGAGFEGPVVHVIGARNVAIRDITVQNGEQGILVERLSTVTLEDIVSRRNSSHGVEVIQSHVVATDLRSHDNDRVGLIVNRNSEVRLTDSTLEANGISGLVLFSCAIGRLEGTNIIRDNGAEGVTLGLGGMIFSIGAELTIENNGAAGFFLQQGGSAQFLGGTITVRGNEGDGIALDLGSSLVLGIGDFGVPGEVLVEDNNGDGISVEASSYLANDAIMPLTVRSNSGDGVYTDASHILVGGATIEENEGTELELVFGARATIEGVMVDEIVCGELVLVRGSVSCP